MTRRSFLKEFAGHVAFAGVAPLLALSATPFVKLARGAVSGQAAASEGTSPARGMSPSDRIKKSPEEWRRLLAPAAYDVLFQEKTERSFSSPLNHEKRAGVFLCAACFNPLFSSDAKFDSGTGWPSFFRSIAGHTETKRDFYLIIPRTEYHCMRCGGHQGHLFDDGPPPTGQRWCNNGVALLFIPKGDPIPPLRT